MYRLIIVPLDGSDFSEAALPMAIDLAKRTQAAVHLVSAVTPFPTYTTADWEVATRSWFGKYLDAVSERVADETGTAVSAALVEGDPSEAIHREAHKMGADLIVMATHGRGALSRAWIGSVADNVARHSDRPVLLVRPSDEAAAATVLDTILVPLDGSELSEEALLHAVELGELFDSAYHLTRVVPYPLTVASPYLPDTIQSNVQWTEDAKNAAAEYLEDHAERLRKRGMRVTASVVVEGQPGRAIVSEAEEVGCGAIAMATHGHTGMRRALLGSAADKVLRATHTPLLLYRPPPSEEEQRAVS